MYRTYFDGFVVIELVAAIQISHQYYLFLAESISDRFVSDALARSLARFYLNLFIFESHAACFFPLGFVLHFTVHLA